MSSMSTVLLVICLSIALIINGQGAPILDDLFRGFVRDSQLASDPAKEGAIVKRRIYADNPDAKLKQISLQSLIGDVEDSLYNAALSVSSVAENHDAVVLPEVKPVGAAGDDRSIKKRQTENNKQITATAGSGKATVDGQFVTTEATPESENIYLQTTQKVPATKGVPAHLLIDRIAVQPHEGDLPFIPAFQLYHTKVISATFKDPASSSASTASADGDGSGSGSGSNSGSGSAESAKKSTKISIAQTAVQATNAAGAPVSVALPLPPVITISTTNPSEKTQTVVATATLPATAAAVLDTTKSTATTIHLQNVRLSPSKETAAATTTAKSTAAAAGSAAGSTPETTPSSLSTSTTTSTATSASTKLPIIQLKEAEEELKEKVAEIEADPVILTARV